MTPNPEDIKMPKYPSIELTYDNITHQQINAYKDILHTKFNAKCIIRKLSNKIDTKIMINTKNNKDILENITDKNIIHDIIVNYFVENKIEDETIKKISKVLKTIINEKNYDFKSKSIKLNKLAFSNFMKYGEHNIIDFSKIKDITGIIGASYIGKSSIIDCIIYSIFGETVRHTYGK